MVSRATGVPLLYSYLQRMTELAKPVRPTRPVQATARTRIPRRRRRLSAIIALVLATCGWQGGCVPVVEPVDTPDPAVNDVRQPFSFNLSAARHVDQPFSSRQVDDVFSFASRILQRRDFDCPDVACPVTFARLGEVSAFDSASPIITSEAQLDAVFSQPEDIKIVTAMIGVCGVPSDGNMTTILGCASTGGSVVIIATADPDVWAHEWGHVQGLRHRDDCARNLMHSFEVLTNAVNSMECDAFLSPIPQSRLLRQRPLAQGLNRPQLANRDVNTHTPADWIDEWIPRTYRSGIPVSCLPREPEAVPADTLLARLESGLPAAHLANLVRTLGLLGDPVACQPLIDQVESFSQVVTLKQFYLLAESLLALGRLASTDTTGSAVDLLCEAAIPDFWKAASLQLQIGDLATRDVSHDLARIAVAALGLCEHPVARQRLIDLNTLAKQGRFADPWMADQVFEAISRSNGDLDQLRTDDRQTRFR